MNTTTANLPALIERTGGALLKVMSDLDAYVDPKYPLNRKGQLAIGRIVQDFPALNCEQDVELLVEIMSRHGVTSMSVLRGYLNDFGTRFTYLAITFLFEEGKHGHRGKDEDQFSPGKKYQPMQYVRSVLELIESASAYLEIDSVEEISDLVESLGGLDDALKLSPERLEIALLRLESDFSPYPEAERLPEEHEED